MTRRAVGLLALVLSWLTAAADAPVVRWGGPQEGIQVGMAIIEGFGKNGALAIYARPATNYAKNLVVPKLPQAFQVVLRDTSNNVVSPKPGLTQFGAPLETKMSRQLKIRRQLRFLDQEGWQLGFVRIDDCFVISEAGDYEVEVRVTLLKETGDKLLPVLFAPIRIKLQLVANTPKPLPLKK